MSDKLAVIGGGLGGIAAALRARAAGYNVSLFERLPNLGGRAQSLKLGPYRHDTGPTVITAPFLFDELFELFKEKRENSVKFVELDPWYRFYFRDGSIFDYGGNPEKISAEIKRYSPADLAGYNRLLKHSQALYETAYEELADTPFHRLSTLVKAIPTMLRLRADRSVWQLVGKYIKNQNLRRALSIQPLLLGGNPLDTTCIYSLIHYLERAHGVHFAMGGMGAVISALEALMKRQSIKVVCNTSISKFKTVGNRIQSVVTEDNQEIEANQYIFNGDPLYLYRDLLDHSSLQVKFKMAYKRSMGLFVIFFGTSQKFDQIPHHSIWMGERFSGLLRDIFDHQILPKDFSLYIHRPTATDPSFAPEGHDSFYVLAPVPNLQANINWKTQAPLLAKKIIDALNENEMPGLKSVIKNLKIMTPEDFKEDYLSVDGAGFSIAPTFKQSAWFRFHNLSESFENLFLVGAGTHPGAGVPGVLNSAKVVEKLIS